MLIPFNELFEKYHIRANGVLHIGANDGAEAEAYHHHGIREVIWVEALPDVCAKLRVKLKAFPVHSVINACVSDVDGKAVTFHVANNGGQSSSYLEFGTHEKEHPTVKFVEDIAMITARADSLITEENLEGRWLLNIDLQGAELDALIGMGTLIEKFDWVYIEVNERELYKGCPLIEDIDDCLGAREFKRVKTKMTGSGWGDAFYVRESDSSPSAGVEISNEDEIVAAIKSTRGKFLMFSGDFGPSGLVGRIVTPNCKGEPRTEK